jgi:WW domain-binding protein 4
VPAAKPKLPPPKPSDPYTNYTTAASLGFTDPDVERLVAEAEVRKNEGRAGDWVTVVPPPPPLLQAGEASPAAGVKLEHETSVGEVRKRVEEPVDEDDTRQFKMRKKTVALGLGEIYDPGIIRVKPRVDPNVKGESDSVSLANSMPAPGPTLGGEALGGSAKMKEVNPTPMATEKPAWIRREWKWAGEDEGQEVNSGVSLLNSGLVDGGKGGVDAISREAIPDAIQSQDDNDSERTGDLKKEDAADSELLSGGSSAGGLFRKRKARGSTSTRGRREA